MTIHHLNCGTMRPYLPRVRGIVYCLLVETSDGLALVDTGFGTNDYTQPSPVMNVFLASLRTPRDLQETALHQVQVLGYQPADVRHIVLTHLHLDHAGGLPDFPHAQVHVHRREAEAAMHPKGFKELFYIQAHWAHGPHWALHDTPTQRWFGFDAIPILPEVTHRLLLVPLHGHTRGHCGVAVETEEGWLFHCGDAAASFYPVSDPHLVDRAPPGGWVKSFIGPHVPRLRQLVRAHSDQVQVISGHDLPSFERFTQAQRKTE